MNITLSLRGVKYDGGSTFTLVFDEPNVKIFENSLVTEITLEIEDEGIRLVSALGFCQEWAGDILFYFLDESPELSAISGQFMNGNTFVHLTPEQKEAVARLLVV